MSHLRIWSRGALLAALMPVIASADPFFSAANAIRDNNGDGTPDEIANYASNYVYNSNGLESRTFAEFPLIGSLGAFQSATLSFDVFQYNTSDMPQTLNVYGYLGDGLITLADWNAVGTFIGATPIIPGFSDWADRGKRYHVSFDITASLLTAKNGNAPYYSIFILDPTRSDPPPNSFTLVTTGNYAITTSNTPPRSVPDQGATAALVAAALAAMAFGARPLRLRSFGA